MSVPLHEPRDCIGDLVLYERAFRAGWPISQEAREKAIRKCLAILDDPSLSATRQIGAIRALIAADQINLGIAKARQQERTVDLQSHAAVIRSILSTPQGRELLAQLADLPRPDTTPAQPGQPSATVQEATPPPPGGCVGGQMLPGGGAGGAGDAQGLETP